MANLDSLTPFTKDDDRAKVAGGMSKRGPGLKPIIENFFYSQAKQKHIDDLEKQGIDTGNGSKIEFLIAKLYQLALQGKIEAFKILFAYWEGLPKSNIDHNVSGSISLNQVAEKLLSEHTDQEIIDIVKYNLE